MNLPGNNMRILIVQTSYLGDTILSTPVIAGVHQLYPAARLWMMTTPAGFRTRGARSFAGRRDRL
jgi:hypothetical protein